METLLNMNTGQTTSSTPLSGVAPAKHSQSPDSEKAWVTLVVNSCSPILELLKSINPDMSAGKTYPVVCHPTEEGILVPSSGGWRNSGMGGLTESWTLDGSESHSDAGACSLSDILVTGDVPQRYFLTPRACAGILRRAEARHKVFPEVLRKALQKVVDQGK